jgi:hypothetical protein
MGGSLEKRLAHDKKCSTMAWEQRGPQTYYYRSIRRNGYITKDYLGTGPLAELSAAEDAARRVPASHRGRGLAPGMGCA